MTGIYKCFCSVPEWYCFALLMIVYATGCWLFGQSCKYSQEASDTRKLFSKQLMNTLSAIHELQQLCVGMCIQAATEKLDLYSRCIRMYIGVLE